MSFSQRHGYTNAKTEILRDGIDDATKNKIWSVIRYTFLEYDAYVISENEILQTTARRIYFKFLKLPLDEIPNHYKDFVFRMREWYFAAEWYKVFDFMEFLVNVEFREGRWEEGRTEFDNSVDYRTTINQILEEERSAYRFVDTKITEITNETERLEVEEATQLTGKFSSVSIHIKAAVELLSDRGQDQNRNVIKEAISAVESAAKIVSGNAKGSLGDALKILEKKHGLHVALKEGLMKIYGYTSDSDGIRHSLLEMPNVDAADAKFMLVACSAFCNFLIERDQKDS